MQTVFEHFTCPSLVNEGWGPHSFTADAEFHCRCDGQAREYWIELRRSADNALEAAERSNATAEHRTDNLGVAPE